MAKSTGAQLVGDYLDRLHEINSRRRGTPELSFRGALENLLNGIGQTLDPPLQATAELADSGVWAAPRG